MLALVALGSLLWHAHEKAKLSVIANSSKEATSVVAEPISDKSIAVLPLLNESGDAKQDYFSDGLSEDLISALGQINDLMVIGRNSSFKFRGSQQDNYPEISRKLRCGEPARRHGAQTR